MPVLGASPESLGDRLRAVVDRGIVTESPGQRRLGLAASTPYDPPRTGGFAGTCRPRSLRHRPPRENDVVTGLQPPARNSPA